MTQRRVYTPEALAPVADEKYGAWSGVVGCV